MTDGEEAFSELVDENYRKAREVAIKKEIAKVAEFAGVTSAEANENIRVFLENWKKETDREKREMIVSREELLRYGLFLESLKKDSIEFFLSLNCTLPQAMRMAETYSVHGIISPDEYALAMKYLQDVATQYDVIRAEVDSGHRSVAELIKKSVGV